MVKILTVNHLGINALLFCHLQDARFRVIGQHEVDPHQGVFPEVPDDAPGIAAGAGGKDGDSLHARSLTGFRCGDFDTPPS